MPPLPSRKELEAMKRADLQRICKDYGVKANLKSEALIDLLLDTQSAPTPHPQPPPQPHPPEPPRRSVSIRQQSVPKAGPSRTTSMIIHEPDEENEDLEDLPSNEFKEPSPSPPPIPPPRTRKAKELQTRLGVGKPVAAGGPGPRAITRSSGSSSKGKRAKSSRSLKPREAPIQEEPEPTHTTTPEPDHLPITEGEKDKSPPRPQTQRDPTPKLGAKFSVEEVNRLIARAVQPLQDEIETLKSELQKLQASESQAKELKQHIAELNETHKKVKHDLDNVKNIAAGIQIMKDEIQQLRDDFDDQAFFRPSTPKPTGQKAHTSLGLGVPSAFRLGQPLSEVPGEDPLHDTKTTTTLGKRSRDVTLASQKPSEPTRPNAKRLRIEKDSDANESDVDNENEEIPVKRSFPAFAVYNDVEESDDPPPPTNHLPHTFASDSAGPSHQGARTSSAQGIENQTRPFNFAFQPITSTPNAFASTFPYPEPPQSPSPAGVGTGSFMGQQSGRTDVFKQFGLPSPARPSRLYGALPVTEDRDEFINPAALSQPDMGNSRDGRPSGDLGSGSSKQRTMYGTELEGDTRFGDFGLEGGVAGGFWPNARF